MSEELIDLTKVVKELAKAVRVISERLVKLEKKHKNHNHEVESAMGGHRAYHTHEMRKPE